MLVTCAIATTYPKRAALLAAAMRGYACQRYTPRELLVFNDGPVALSAARGDVRVINAPGTRLTLGTKRNVLHEAARGEYVAVWDDDDLQLPDYVERLVAAARGAQLDHVHAQRVYLADEDYRVVDVVTEAGLSTSLLRRDAILAAGGHPDIDYLEDLGAKLRMVAAGARTGRVPTDRPPSYVHRRFSGGTNMSAGRASSQMDRRMEASREARARWPDPALLDAQRRIDALLIASTPTLLIEQASGRAL